MKSLFALLFLFLSATLHAQLSSKQTAELRDLLFGKVNNYRVESGLQALKSDSYLQDAAEDHSKYMAKYDTLTHEEKGAMKTPERRVKKSGGKDFEFVGENVLYREVENFKLNKKELESLAEEMFQQWKNSPPHNLNMLHSQYVFGDLGIYASTKSNRLYATQVFGSKGQRVEGQLSRNSFGIRDAATECSGIFETQEHLIANIGNSIQLENDTFFLYFHNIHFIEEVFNTANTGLVVDVIQRDQLPCDGPNVLDMSKVYDGIMLKPVYRDELFRNNRAEGKHRIITPIGVLPESLRGKVIEASLIFIRNNEKCRYEVPAFVPHAPYEMQGFEPSLVNPSVKMVQTGIGRSETLDFEFNTNITTASNTPEIKFKDEEIHSVSIVSYSSIEGSEENNINLHRNRGKYIENYIASRTKSKNYPTEIEASENWRLFDFQVRYNYADTLLEKSRDELREYVVSSNDDLDWEQLLSEQRVSTAYINYKETLQNPTTEESVAMNLRTAIVEKNDVLAQKALYEYYHHIEEVGPELLFDGQIFEALLSRKSLVENAAALMSKLYLYAPSKATLFIHSWVMDLDNLSEKARTNLLHLYSLTGYSLVISWDVSSQRLSNVIHPKRLEQLVKDDLPKEIAINANLTFLYYYGHTLEQEGLNRSFEFVKEYVQSKELNQDALEKMALFFNEWSRYDLTEEMLLKKFRAGDISRNNLIILAHTMTRYFAALDDDDAYLSVMQKLKEVDPEYWCDWLDQEFQIFRNQHIKRLFCTSCN